MNSKYNPLNSSVTELPKLVNNSSKFNMSFRTCASRAELNFMNTQKIYVKEDLPSLAEVEDSDNFLVDESRVNESSKLYGLLV